MVFISVTTMHEQASMLEPNQTARDVGGAPFASELVTLSKQEHIELVMQTH